MVKDVVDDRPWAIAGPLVPIACGLDKSWPQWAKLQSGTQCHAGASKKACCKHQWWKTQMPELYLNVLCFGWHNATLKVTSAARGRISGHYQQRGGSDDESFSVWHSGQEQNAMKSPARTDALIATYMLVMTWKCPAEQMYLVQSWESVQSTNHKIQ